MTFKIKTKIVIMITIAVKKGDDYGRSEENTYNVFCLLRDLDTYETVTISLGYNIVRDL